MFWPVVLCVVVKNKMINYSLYRRSQNQNWRQIKLCRSRKLQPRYRVKKFPQNQVLLQQHHQKIKIVEVEAEVEAEVEVEVEVDLEVEVEVEVDLEAEVEAEVEVEAEADLEVEAQAEAAEVAAAKKVAQVLAAARILAVRNRNL